MPQPKYKKSSDDALISFIRSFGGRQIVSTLEYRHWRGYTGRGYMPRPIKDMAIVFAGSPEAQRPDIQNFF